MRTVDEIRADLVEGGGAPAESKLDLSETPGFELLVEAAHDLRSPLTSISFLSETLREGYSGPVNEVQRSQLALIHSAALAMTSVVSDLVDLARQGRDLVGGAVEPFSIAATLQEVERLIRPIADVKGVDFSIEHAAYDRVEGYPLAMHRALLNLATNALKFTDVGSVSVSTRQLAHNRFKFSVRDTGPGFAEHERDELFQPFRSSKIRKGYVFSGSGLGLHIVSRILDAMDAELHVESEVGVGSEFWFEVEMSRVNRL